MAEPTTERTRCGQTTAAGTPCRNYAVDDGRCRVHARMHAATDDSPGDGGLRRAAPQRDAPTSTARAGAPAASATAPGGSRTEATSVLDALAEVLGDGLGDHLEQVAEFVRRRFTGDYEVDEYGLDPHLTDNVLMPLCLPLYRHWWRVASHGRDHLPDGGGLVVANHAGTLPADGVMLHVDLWEATGRHPRELGADLVFETPFIGHLARKSGATRAGNADADALLARGELVAVFPEGFKGLGKPFSNRYQLARFGRGGFVATALRAGVPILPTAIVGSEEIYPLIWDARQVANALGLPYFPIVAQLLAVPFIGPLGLLPLPSKWSITYGDPIDTSGLGAGAADDPMVVFDLADQVRATIQQMLTTIVMGRQTVFF